MMFSLLKSILIIISLICSNVFGQTINRYGTTAANFLEIGVGSRATSMGDAYVAVANDVSSIYWNPAGLSNVSNSSALFMVQPWLVDIDMLFAGGAVVVPNVGVLGLGITLYFIRRYVYFGKIFIKIQHLPHCLLSSAFKIFF